MELSKIIGDIWKENKTDFDHRLRSWVNALNCGKGWNIVKNYFDRDLDNLYYHLLERGVVKGVEYGDSSELVIDDNETLGVE